MSKYLLQFLIISFLFPISIYSQGWEKIYGDSLIQYSSSSTLCPNGDILIAGAKQIASGNINSQVFLHRLDSTGNLIWEYCDTTRILPFPGVTDVLVTSDSNYLVTFNIPDSESFVHKISPQGHLLWEFNLAPHDSARNSRFIEIGDGGYCLLNLYEGDNGYSQTSVIKLGSGGNLIWKSNISPLNNSFLGRAFTEISNGEIMIVGTENLANDSGDNIQIVKIDASGNKLLEKSFDLSRDTRGKNIINLENGNLLIGAAGSINSLVSNIILMEIDELGNEIKINTYPEELYINNQINIVQTADGGIAFSGSSNNFGSDDADMYLAKTNSARVLQWIKNYGRTYEDYNNGLVLNNDNGYYLTGHSRKSSTDTDIYVVKTDSLGFSLTNNLNGQVFSDQNDDCLLDTNEFLHSNWLVEAKKAEDIFLTQTDSFGHYSFLLDSGNYEITAYPVSDYWGICTNNATAVFTGFFQSQTIDIGVDKLVDCPLLEVSIGTPFLRRCFENTYTVQYCNWGTTTAESSYVEISLDQYMLVTNTSIPIANQNGNIYTFDLGDIEINDCGTFTIDVQLGNPGTFCEELPLGLTHCVEAHIFPDSICNPNPNWSGASIEVDATCQGDSIVFTITNVGTVTTTVPLGYIIIEDDVILYTGFVILNPGQNEVIPISTNGSAFRLEVEQEPFHPGRSMPSISVEGCGDENTIFDWGFINIFAQDDGNPFIDIDCEQNTGSYDPNDKQGFPLGYDDENYIDPDQTIDYKIRFQNTGTDTAFNIIIRDTLSELLDWATIRPGVSSHPFTFSLNSFGALEFKFNDIMLPDSNVNQLGSNGFVKFRISPKVGLPLETEIYNSAAIYFDFNAPIFTNETLHTLGEPLLDGAVYVENISTSEAQVAVAPNPFREQATFTISGLEIVDGIFELFNLQGQLIQSETFLDQQYILRQNGLAPGVYFFTIRNEGQLISTGKLIYQH